jgi:hypothetical protein
MTGDAVARSESVAAGQRQAADPETWDPGVVTGSILEDRPGRQRSTALTKHRDIAS